jgi:predicted transposase YbfD/YdcC
LLRRFRPFKDGTPAHDHLGDILATLDAEQFQGCFAAWVAAVTGVPEGVVAIDGKTSRRSGRKGASRDPIHMVSAFAARQRLVLAQVKVAEKSNEIIAIPKLLDMLAIEGAILTIDAMGCQRDIAQRVIDKKADYVLALKGNQGSLRDDAELLVTEQKASGFVDTEISRDTTVVIATMAASRPEPRPSSTTSSGSGNAIVGRASKAWSSSRAAAKIIPLQTVGFVGIGSLC